MPDYRARLKKFSRSYFGSTISPCSNYCFHLSWFPFECYRRIVMGIIKRQAIKQSFVSYSTTVISAIAVIWIYPLDTELYGLARFIIDTALILAPFIMLGLGSVSIRFFPDFKNDKNGHNGFLGYLLLLMLISSVAVSLLYFLYQDAFLSLYANKKDIYIQYLFLVIPVAILNAFILILVNYTSNFQRIVFPAFFQNLVRFTLPLLILYYALSVTNLDFTVYGIPATFLLTLVCLMCYLGYLGQFKLKTNWSVFTWEKTRGMANYAAFGLFNSVGSMLAFRIDLFMVPTLLDFKSNGVYAISFFIANAIAIPTNALVQISGPIITSALKEENYVHIKEIYQKSSLNLMALGLLLFIGIICSVEDLFQLMPKSEQLVGGGTVVLLVGAAKLIDMATSVNNQIINYSKYYRFSFISIAIMAIVNISLNIILIPEYKIVGAATASLISLGIYNLVKLIFIQWKFKMQPFQINSLWVFLIAVLAFLVGSFVPIVGSPLIKIILRSTLIMVIYALPIWYFKLTPDILEIINNQMRKLGFFGTP